MREQFLLSNRFKAAIGSDRPQIGLWQVLASPITAEICAGAGFDWLLFDGEHGPNDLSTLLAQLQAVAPYPTHAVARLPKGETALIKQYLDIGFQTLLIPFVESASEAEELVRAIRYPPEGLRGVAGGIVRASRWGRIPDYLDRAAEELCLLVQVETIAGLSAISEIAETNGVDGVFIGPADLSAAFGFRGRPGAPEMIQRIETAIASVRAVGKAVGLLSLDPVFAQRCIELGCTFMAVGTDSGLLVQGTNRLFERFGTRSDASKGGTY